MLNRRQEGVVGGKGKKKENGRGGRERGVI